MSDTSEGFHLGTKNNLEHLRVLGERLSEPEIYGQIVEELPDALIVITERPLGQVVIFNKQASYLFGYHPSEVIGNLLQMLIPPSKQGQHDDHLTNFFRSPRARPMGVGLSLTALHKSGREVPVEINLSPIVAPSGTYGMAVIRVKG